MDNNEEEERFKKLGFVPQKENVYNKLLPYADKLDEESTLLFQDIKTNLIKSVLAREIRPGCAVWTARLSRYLRIYGFKFSKADHVTLIKLYYELLVLPNLEPTRISKFGSMLTFLLKKSYLLTQDDIQLEWKPLFDLCIRILEKSKFEIGMYRYPHSLQAVLKGVVGAARTYFPWSATQEILDAFRPRLCPYSGTYIMDAVEYLQEFLPTVMKPEYAEFGYNLWFEEFMNLWEICHNANLWENHMAILMARLASHQIGYLDWEPYIPIMYVRFLRTLHLPVGYKKKQCSKVYKIDVSVMTLWIVSTLGGGSEKAYFHLEKFMHILETFYHPANAGMWSGRIREFLKRLSFMFVQRVHNERYKSNDWRYNYRESHKLTETDIDRFVNILKPSLEQAMFCRQGIQEIMLTLNYLASLRPGIIVPIALEKLVTSLDSLTEPHKLTNSMMNVVAVSRYMVQGDRNNYPNGQTHVIPLLMSLLPGIDPNDMKKCFMTFNFIVYFCSLCPLVDCSGASTYYDDLTETEHIVCEQSAEFENFLMQFLDKIYMWIDSNSLEFTRMEISDHNFNDVKSKAESFAENALVQVVSCVLTQCPSELFLMALKRTFGYATSRITELNISGKLLMTLCRAFTKVNPKETLKLFVPHLCDTFERLVEEHGDITSEERLNGELLYNLLLLAGVVDGKGEVLNYMDRLIDILDKTLYIKCKEANRSATLMLSVILHSLSRVVPKECRSVLPSLDTPLKDFLAIRSWGCPGDLNNLNLQWYTPGKPEVDCIQRIVYKYLLPELDKLDKLCNREITLTREDLRKSLSIVFALLASQSVLPVWEEQSLELVDTCLEPWAFQLIVGGAHKVSMPDGSNVRKAISDTIRRVQTYIQLNDEGDTKSLHSIINMYDVLLFNKFREFNFEMHWASFHVTKRTFEDRLHQRKKHLRHILIDRVILHQETRNECRTCTFTETHKDILLALFDLSVSRYSQVRVFAQSKLFQTVSTYSHAASVLVPYIQEILQMDSVEHHEKFKGCLHVLLGPKSTPIIAHHHWHLIKEIWPTLVNSKPSEKISIVNLMTNLSDAVSRSFPTIAIGTEVSDKCIEMVMELSKSIPNFNIENYKLHIDGSKRKEQEKKEIHIMIYNELTAELLHAVNSGKLNWRHHAICLNFIHHLVHPDIKFNADVIKYFLTALINDSIIVRKTALKVVLLCLAQNKPKFVKVEINPYGFSTRSEHKIVPGIRKDNEWLLYNSNTIPKTSAQWEELRYVHDTYTGFYCWPQKLKVYASSDQQPLYDTRKDNLNDNEKAIFDFFNAKSNVDALVKYWSMEEKKGKDQFNLTRFYVIRNLFKTFDDSLLNLFIPHLQKLVSDTQEHNQRCAAEILAGVIRGAKHWTFDKVQRLWSTLIPIFRTAFNNMTNETVNDWSSCITVSLDSMDPSRCHWLIEFLMDNPINEQTSFMSCCRVNLLHTALDLQPWRYSELVNRLLEYFKNHLSHPFQNVREKISACLVSLFCKDIVFPDGNFTNCPRVSDFFSQIMPKLNVLYLNTLQNLDHSNEKNSNAIDVDVLEHHLQKTRLDNENNKEEFIRLFKTIIKYVTGSVAKMNYSAVTEHYDLLPLVCILQSNDTDDELKNVCLNFLAILSSTIILDKHLPAALEAAKKVAVCPFWSARSVITEFISVLVFHNMALVISRDDWVLEVQNMILMLLEDVQPEVRTQAGKVLSGLFHYKFVPDPLKLLESFKLKAKTKLKDKTQRKSKAATSELNGSQRSYSNSTLRFRHAGVLGLCAFISSHPYDVPDFMPDIFGELGAHLNDPQPIPATIRKTLGDFKRTHHDNWEIHKMKFTEEELSVLSDLTVPPTYYA